MLGSKSISLAEKLKNKHPSISSPSRYASALGPSQSALSVVRKGELSGSLATESLTHVTEPMRLTHFRQNEAVMDKAAKA